MRFLRMGWFGVVALLAANLISGEAPATFVVSEFTFKRPTAWETMEVPPAMVQIIENHAELVGTLVSVQPDPSRGCFVILTVDVGHAAPVQGFPNLLADTIGKRVAVTARADSALATRDPGPVSFHARKTGPNQIFADP